MDKLPLFATVRFEVKPGKEADAEAVIKEFVEAVGAEEPETLEYRSMRERDNPRRYVHVMRFANSAAHSRHRQTPHVARFVEKLYPLCVAEPEPQLLECFVEHRS